MSFNPHIPAHQVNYSKFIYLDRSTSGNDGRTVYINPNLLLRFFEVVDIDSAQGQQIKHALIGLKNSASGTQSDTNTSNALQFRNRVANVVITYSVLQTGGRGAGVYITDLTFGFSQDQNKAGLYKVQRSMSQGRAGWKVEEDSSQTMPSLIGALGALPPREDGTASVSETAHAFAESALLKEQRSIGNGFSLFYTPVHAIDHMGTWITSQQKCEGSTANMAQAFAKLLANTENKTNYGEPETYKWYIVGKGAVVFQEALAIYNQTNLRKHKLSRSHKFYFVDPQVPLGALKKDLMDNHIDYYHDKSLASENMSLSSRVHQMMDPTKLFIHSYQGPTVTMLLDQTEEEWNKKVASARSAPQPYFTEIVGQISKTLGKRWAL